MKRKEIFDAVGALAPGIWNKSGTVAAMDKVLDLGGIVDAPPPSAGEPTFPVEEIDISAEMAAEIVGHEAIVQEAYKDSVGVWTWGIGVTDKSGHGVMRYKDNPQPISRVLEVYLWLLNTGYAPDVRKAFAGKRLTLAQFTAALSFHYNTGAIMRASWVDLWAAGKIDAAKKSIMEWRSPPEIVERRAKERDLFFDGKWSGDGYTTVWPVKKPSYTPNWGGGKRVEILGPLRELINAA